uniref:Non-specific serine/threonine protein kinase n=1 Tax=Globodera rostochiensis TaxID=31243 RepID=A0A914HEZ5_GLORO
MEMLPYHVQPVSSSQLGARGAVEVKKHRFFDGINWEAVERRQTAGPIKPSMAGGVADVENFAAEFTAQTPLFSPADKPPAECHTFFRGYSFVSPSVIFASDNVIGQECLEASVRLLSAQSSPFFANYRLDITAQGLLGKGSFSICRRCERVADGRQFAVKIVSQRFAHQARREVRVLEALQPHAHIVPLVDAMSDAFHHYIVLELLEGGELLQRLRRMEKFTELQAAEIMAQLVAAVKHMHDRDIVHRDLKPENILFERDQPGHVAPKLRLVDFGFARILPRPSSSSTVAQSLITPLCGTLHYAAPEVLDIEDELPQYNQQCDLWSLGVILFTMLSGKVPFHAKSQAESAADIIARIRAADFSFLDPVWTMVSQSAKDLITGLLTVDPTRRLSLAQLGAHPWLRAGRNKSSSSSSSASALASSDMPQCGGTELPTPTILPPSADETFNATMSAFLHANRDGFQLMDVQTAPLLVKRRGMKRQRGQETTDGGSGVDEKMEQCPDGMKLCTVPEGPEHGEQSKRRPTTLDLFGTGIEEQQQGTPNSAAFTEYRDTKPPYLKYSRDDFARAESGGTARHNNNIASVNEPSSGCSSLSGASTIRLSNDSNESQ